MKPTNRHPVDELAEIRAERQRLEDREAELRAILLAEGADLHGSEHTAHIVTRKQRYISRELLAQHFGPNAFAKVSTSIAITAIRLKPAKTSRTPPVSKAA